MKIVSEDARINGFDKVDKIEVIVGDLSNVLSDVLCMSLNLTTELHFVQSAEFQIVYSFLVRHLRWTLMKEVLNMKIKLQEDVLKDQNLAAKLNRETFKKNKTLVINLISSPGACSSGNDFGKDYKVVSLSVPEGNDKIPKYLPAVKKALLTGHFLTGMFILKLLQ